MNLKNIKTLITDVDGVLTDGGFYYNDTGKILKKFGPHDSDGFKILIEKGINCFAISADERGFPITKRRLEDMGIPIALVKEKERFEYVKNLTDLDTACFVGDGYHDIQVLRAVAFGVAPANAPSIVKKAANYTTEVSGGNGVIFEVALRLMEGTK